MTDEFTACISDAIAFGQKNELGSADLGRHGGCQILGLEIEQLAGRRIAERREQHDFALFEPRSNGLVIDIAHQPGEQQIDAIDDAGRTRQYEITARNAATGGRQRPATTTERECRLDIEAHGTDYFAHFLHGRSIADTQCPDRARRDAARGETLLDLRTRAEHHHQANTDRRQQQQVADQIGEAGIGHRLAAEIDHEGLGTVLVKIGRHLAQPGDHGFPFQTRTLLGHRSIILARRAKSIGDILAILPPCNSRHARLGRS